MNLTAHILLWTLTVLCGYLLGAIPFGYLIARVNGVDIRTVGSKSTGATNVFRSIGKKAGTATFVLDLAKGVLAASLLPLLLAHALRDVEATRALLLTGGIAAVAGHNWSCFLGFRGGKGVATSLGVLIGVAWEAALLGLCVWLVVFLLSRYSSLASIAAAVTAAAASWFLYYPPPWFPVVVSVLALLAVARHHANIRRLINGTEHRFTFKRTPLPPETHHDQAP